MWIVLYWALNTKISVAHWFQICQNAPLSRKCIIHFKLPVRQINLLIISFMFNYDCFLKKKFQLKFFITDYQNYISGFIIFLRYLKYYIYVHNKNMNILKCKEYKGKNCILLNVHHIPYSLCMTLISLWVDAFTWINNTFKLSYITFHMDIHFLSVLIQDNQWVILHFLRIECHKVKWKNGISY